MRSATVIFRLGLKEIASLLRDPVLMGLILYAFTLAIFSVAEGVRVEVRNAAIAIVDEDRSELSARLKGAFLPPEFKPPVEIGLDEMDAALDTGRVSFVLDIPPDFEADLLAGRMPSLQLNVDATAMTLAGNGTRYIQEILFSEIRDFLGRDEVGDDAPATLAIRAQFNPNLQSEWFYSVMQLVNNVTILAIVLSGAAVIREREHGTIEHLLVMPVTPTEIMLSKVWANGLVIVAAAILSIHAVVRGALGVPIAGSTMLFALGSVVYLFSVTSLGIMLATIARSMPQFGLLSIPVFVVLNLLSGATTPLESMPETLGTIMQASPATHFVAFSQAVLYRGAGIATVWPQLVAIAGIGAVFFALALLRFRATMAADR